MKKSIILVLTVMLLPVFVLVARADYDSDDGYRGLEYRGLENRAGQPMLTQENKFYKDACGECHMAYPPQLMLASTWKEVMAGLGNHFGDNAELDAENFKKVSEYLDKNAADNVNRWFAARVLRQYGDKKGPLRISEMPYIQRAHRGELPRGVFKPQGQVDSLAQCNQCHPRAELAIFSEREIRIPGYGRWDD